MCNRDVTRFCAGQYVIDIGHPKSMDADYGGDTSLFKSIYKLLKRILSYPRLSHGYSRSAPYVDVRLNTREYINIDWFYGGYLKRFIYSWTHFGNFSQSNCDLRSSWSPKRRRRRFLFGDGFMFTAATAGTSSSTELQAERTTTSSAVPVTRQIGWIAK